MEKSIRASLKNKYGITVLDIIPHKHLWEIDSPKGKWMIKKYQNKQLIYWLFYIGNELRNRGFTSFAPILPTIGGNPYFKERGNYLIVMPFLEGRSARYDKKDDLIKALKTLAELHHHGILLDKQLLAPRYKPIHQKLWERLIEFKKLYDVLLLKKDKGLLERQILSLGNEMMKFGKKALENLDYQSIERLNQEAIEHRVLSHRDLASHNLILGKKNYIIDFDLSSFEPQILDLWQIISRMLIEWQWNTDIFQQLEAYYQSNRKLQQNEQRVIRQLLKYPNDFFRESLGAYHLPQKYKRENVNRVVAKYAKHFTKYQDFQKY